MPIHSLSLQRHPAFKAAQRYLQFNAAPLETTRIAYTDDVMAISGNKNIGGMSAGDFALDQYKVDLSSMEADRRFSTMIQKYDVKQMERWNIDNCAEAHLWMTLMELHARYALEGLAPRHRHLPPKRLNIWVFEIDRKNRPKQDSPCKTCQQWVRREFLGVNGTY